MGHGLVFIGAEESRARTIRFSDDPQFDVVPGSIGAENSKAILLREFIFAFILVAKLAPISGLMSLDKLEGVLIRFLKRLQSTRRGDNTSQRKFWQQSIHIGYLCFHFDCLQVPRILE